MPVRLPVEHPEMGTGVKFWFRIFAPAGFAKHDQLCELWPQSKLLLGGKVPAHRHIVNILSRQRKENVHQESEKGPALQKN